jgi:hypothetical protein
VIAREVSALAEADAEGDRSAAQRLREIEGELDTRVHHDISDRAGAVQGDS